MASQFGSRSFIKKHEPSIDLQVRRFLLRTVNDNEDLNYNLEVYVQHLKQRLEAEAYSTWLL